MVSVTKYPTANTNPDSWTNPQNVYDGVEDGTTCASKNFVAQGTKYLYLSDYGFDIPAGAVLDNVFIDHKGIIDCSITAAQVLIFVFRFNFQDIIDGQSDVLYGGSCANTAYKGEVDILPLLRGSVLTVADLNDETFTTYLQATATIASVHRFYCDAAYIRVVYHVQGGTVAMVKRQGVGH